jgi:hypothetical protein
MANSVYQGVHYVDSAGIISKVPLCIESITFYPKAVADVLDLNFWDEGNAVSGSEVFVNASIATGVLTETDVDAHTITAARFPAASVIKIIGGDGLAANHTYHLLNDAGDNHEFETQPTGSLTDEGPVDFHMICYPARAFFNCLVPTLANTMESKHHYFGGVHVPNLICEGISTDSYAIIYTR